jgi:iron complex outermembrane receptor protein
LLAAFGEAELNFAPQLTVNVGLRVDRYSPYTSAVSPRIAVMYLPTERTSLKYVLGHAFRAPDPYDLFYVDQEDITAPSKDLHPETIDSHSLILDHRLEPWLYGTVVGFFSDLHKEIGEEVDATGSSYFVNGAGDRSYGIASELRADSKSGWAARTSYSFGKTRERENSREVMNSPSHLVKLNAIVPLSRHAFLGAEIFYTGVQQNYLRARIPSSLLTNATLSTKPLWGGWQFSLSSYNLLDRRWYTPTGPELTQKATEQDGRNFRFKISYRLPIRSLRGKP